MAQARRPVRQVIERLLRDGTVVAQSDGTVHRLFPVAVGAAEGKALREWVVREGATRTLEIGLGYGISALFICDGLLSGGQAAASHVAVDPCDQVRRLRPAGPWGSCRGVAGGAPRGRVAGRTPALPQRGAASFCLTNLGWTLEEVSPADELHQWAVLRTSAVPDTRPFDYHVEF